MKHSRASAARPPLNQPPRIDRSRREEAHFLVRGEGIRADMSLLTSAATFDRCVPFQVFYLLSL
jgi:hypothetical protein